MLGFDNQSEYGWDFINKVCDIFKQANAETEIYYAELVAPQEIRLQRNVTENRLKHKPSKRDIEWSNQGLIEWDKTFRFVSNDGEIPDDMLERYIKIDNSNLPPDVVAKMIKERFSL